MFKMCNLYLSPGQGLGLSIIILSINPFVLASEMKDLDYQMICVEHIKNIGWRAIIFIGCVIICILFVKNVVFI